MSYGKRIKIKIVVKKECRLLPRTKSKDRMQAANGAGTCQYQTTWLPTFYLIWMHPIIFQFFGLRKTSSWRPCVSILARQSHLTWVFFSESFQTVSRILQGNSLPSSCCYNRSLAVLQPTDWNIWNSPTWGGLLASIGWRGCPRYRWWRWTWQIVRISNRTCCIAISSDVQKLCATCIWTEFQR